MSSVVIHGHTFKTKISSSEIQKAVGEVAKQINKDLKGSGFSCEYHCLYLLAHQEMRKNGNFPLCVVQ